MRPHIVSSINEGVLVGATLAVLFAITCLAVWLVAFLLRRRFKRLSLPVSLVLSHSLLLLVCVALYPTGIFFGKPPVDDLYGGFFLFPGPHLYLLAGKFFVEPLLPLLSPLLDHIHAHTAAVIAIVFVPALPCLILGGVQWFLVGKIVGWIHRARRKRATQTV